MIIGNENLNGLVIAIEAFKTLSNTILTKSDEKRSCKILGYCIFIDGWFW